MSIDQHRSIVVYGDFNCPFSALASARVAYLERHGLAKVDWRAVEHAPDIPSESRDLSGDQRDNLRGELGTSPSPRSGGTSGWHFLGRSRP